MALNETISGFPSYAGPKSIEREKSKQPGDGKFIVSKWYRGREEQKSKEPAHKYSSRAR